ncbi:MAG: DUF2934 domain-containing protein [Verrucomicrobiota bacterium]|nr:DUF2934 domain-containing protein [Verrucomicrobiota bacterium]MCC6823142.1 DUF2934 domain-containing protein [Limisphaerales bacterium]
MKHHKFTHPKTPPAANTPSLVATEDVDQNEIDFVPAADEVARRAYFSYVNQGSLPGHEVQHWLAAEAELIAERNLTRIHGFHKQT